MLQRGLNIPCSWIIVSWLKHTPQAEEEFCLWLYLMSNLCFDTTKIHHCLDKDRIPWVTLTLKIRKWKQVFFVSPTFHIFHHSILFRGFYFPSSVIPCPQLTFINWKFHAKAFNILAYRYQDFGRMHGWIVNAEILVIHVILESNILDKVCLYQLLIQFFWALMLCVTLKHECKREKESIVEKNPQWKGKKKERRKRK